MNPTGDGLGVVAGTALALLIGVAINFAYRAYRIRKPLATSAVEQTIFRLHGLPNNFDSSGMTRNKAEGLIRQAFRVTDDVAVNILSMTTHPLRSTEIVATLNFSKPPASVSLSRTRTRGLPIRRNSVSDFGGLSRLTLELDTDFLGFTPLYAHDDSVYNLDLVALSGLNGHAFGSFKEKGGPYMWLRDDLGQISPSTRIFIYGYDTMLEMSSSFQSLEDLGLSFKSDLVSLFYAHFRARQVLKPLVLLGHSLGGLVIKEALCKLYESDATEERLILQPIQAVLFFGTPNHGMDIATLIPMAHGQANEEFLRSLGKDSADLRRQAQQWEKAFDSASISVPYHFKIISFYETKESKTAVKVNGVWKMNGPRTKLVEMSSATHGRMGERDRRSIQPIDRDHSELVKFRGPNDPVYVNKVAPLLQNLLETAKEGFSKIKIFKEEEDCLKSLYFPEQDSRVDQIVLARHNTCTWIAQDSEYRTWLSRNQSLLWFQGHPGVGKSTLMKHILEETRTTMEANTLLLFFFFHGRGARLQKTPLGFYRCLLHQLLQQSYEDLAQVSRKQKQKTSTGQSWNWELQWLQEYLERALARICRIRPVLVLVDALDECTEDPLGIGHFIDGAIAAAAAAEPDCNLRICVSCRYYPNLFTSGLSIPMEQKNMEDIIRVIEHRLSVLPESKRKPLQDEIVGKSRGIFQWVVIVCARVIELHRSGKSASSIQQEIKVVPEGLHELYEHLLQKIHPSDKEQTRRMFLWVCFAERPLTVEEMQHALMLSPDMEEVSIQQYRARQDFRDIEDMVNAIRDLSKGLVEVQGSSNAVEPPVGEISRLGIQFIHQTAFDYFVEFGFQTLSSLPEDTTLEVLKGRANHYLSRSCLKYLFMREIRRNIRGILTTTWPLKDAHFAFLDYAVKNMGSHLQDTERYNVDQADLLKYFHWPRDQVRAELLTRLQTKCLARRPTVPAPTLAHFCAEHGLTSPLRALLQKAGQISMTPQTSSVRNPTSLSKLINFDKRDRSLRTPFHWAVLCGKEEVMQTLLSCAEADPNRQDERFAAPIHLAIQKKNLLIVALLLNDGRVNPDLRDHAGRTALHCACRISSPEKVSLLISYEDTIKHSKSITYSLAGTSQAARDRRVDLNAQDYNGLSPLHYAASSHSYLENELRSLSWSNNLDSELSDLKRGEIAHKIRKSEECVSHLLRQQATNPGSQDHLGLNALHLACLRKDCRLFDILASDLRVRNSLGKKDSSGDTALSMAASVGEGYMVKRLFSLYEYDHKDLQKAVENARGECRDFLKKKVERKRQLGIDQLKRVWTKERDEGSLLSSIIE